MFCQQDRAILCRECDGPIHKANEHTQKHDRFVLTGVKISATSAVYSSSSDSASSASESVRRLKSQDSSSNKVVVASPTVPAPISKTTNTCSISSLVPPVTVAVANDKNGGFMNGGADCLTSSLSEYLEMLPGYHVEELLDSSYSDGLSKVCININTPLFLSLKVFKTICGKLDLTVEFPYSFIYSTLHHLINFMFVIISRWVIMMSCHFGILILRAASVQSPQKG